MSHTAEAPATPLERFERVLSRVSYKDWKFAIRATFPGNAPFYLQVQFDAPDHDDERRIEVQSGRKWLLSPHMTDSEILQTALKAVLAAEEHEAREEFKVEGVAVFGPHLDVMTLVALLRGGGLKTDERK